MLGQKSKKYCAKEQRSAPFLIPLFVSFLLLLQRFARLSQDSLGDAGGASGFQDSGAADTISMLMKHTRSSQEGRAFLHDELALSARTGGLGSDALDALMDMLTGAPRVLVALRRDP